jgi:hypothetical protein
MRQEAKMRAAIAIATVLHLPCWAMAEGLAVFPVKLLDTSQEAADQRESHERRLLLLRQVLGTELDDSIMIDPAALQSCAPQTVDCLMSVAARQGADRALFIVAQKTSTLILQLFANLADVESQSLITSHNLNFRGDNDEAWRRAGIFLARQLRDDLAR